MSLATWKNRLFTKLISWVQIVAFAASTVLMPGTARAQTVLDLPAPGMMVQSSAAFVPVMLRAVKIHPDQPLVFDFIIDTGNTNATREDISRESEKIAKYFLASLTIPEKDLWVNLSPYENDRVIADAFGQTEMGRVLLEQDYLLKQLSASLVHPEKELGKAFWSRVYERAKAELGTTDIPNNTFNKVWILPDKAVVYENNDTAIVGESHFKVMLDQDYLAMKNNSNNANLGTDAVSDDMVGQISKISSDVMRDIVIPELEKEVNTGKNFAALRQVQNALILATWYKQNLKESLLAKVYADQGKVAGVNVTDPTIKDQIYEQYIAAYREGVFNLIREDADPVTQELLPRKYFSGGVTEENLSAAMSHQPIARATPQAKASTGEFAMVTVGAVRDVAAKRPDAAMKVIVSSDPDSLKPHQNAFRWSDFDLWNFKALYGKYLKWRANPNAVPKKVISGNFFPTAVMERAERRGMGLRDFGTQVETPKNLSAAKDVLLMRWDVNGGLGNNLLREAFVKEVHGRNDISTKGLDLGYKGKISGFDEQGNPVLMDEFVSITESKYLADIINANQLGGVILGELVTPDSLPLIEKFLNETIFLQDRLNWPDQITGQKGQKRTYRQVMDERGIQIAPPIIVGMLPVAINATGEFTTEAVAPVGHGQLSTLLLRDASRMEIPAGKTLIIEARNGDGATNHLGPHMAGYMAKDENNNPVPIAIQVVPRKKLDWKGGIFGVARLLMGEWFDPNDKRGLTQDVNIPDIMEVAQATGQKSLFAALGLIPGNGEVGAQLFNSNTVGFNVNALQPFLQWLESQLTPEQYAEIITPELILNVKDKPRFERDANGEIVRGADGRPIPKLDANSRPEKLSATQLEGALVSTILNLNRFCVLEMAKNTSLGKQMRSQMTVLWGHTRLVTFVVIDKDKSGKDLRDRFFQPLKDSISFLMYCCNPRRYFFNPATGTNEVRDGVDPGRLPYFNVMDAYYNEALVMQEKAFGNDPDFNELEEISIKCAINAPNVTWKGQVLIEAAADRQYLLQNPRADEIIAALVEAKMVRETASEVVIMATVADIRDALTKIPDGKTKPKILDEEGRPFDNVRRFLEVLQRAVSRVTHDADGREVVGALKNLTRYPSLFESTLDGRILIENKYILIHSNGNIMVEPFKGKGENAMASDAEVEAAMVNDVPDLMEAAAAVVPVVAAPGEKTLDGGIDLNATAGALRVERTGAGIKVTVDPAMLEQIRTQGVDGFRPVIINIVPVTSMLPALGLNDDVAEAGKMAEVPT